MKTQIALIIVAVGLLTGCDTFNKTVATPVVMVDANGNSTTNYIVNPNTKAVVDTVGGFVPVYGTIGAALLGLLATGYTAWLNRRNKSVAVATIQGVEKFREGLQASGALGQKIDDKLVENLKYIHAAAGVAEIANKLVQESTKTKVSAPASADVSKVLPATP